MLKSSLGSLSSTSTGRSFGSFSKLKHSKKINFKNYLNDGDSTTLGNNGGLSGLGLRHQSSLQFGRAQKTNFDDHSTNNDDDDNLPRPAPIIPNSEIKSPPTPLYEEDHGIGFYNVDKDASALAIASFNDSPSSPDNSVGGSGAPKSGLQTGLGLSDLSGDSINVNNKASSKIGAAAGGPDGSGLSGGRNGMFTMDQYLNNL
ncbi:unnamed protein product [Ambrosiozyma monospora]|uniref:Unnamed protein product n=1 Tax=Ambrosiozyma monospora TaxID=43982 RepID=A0ACB5U4R1_AMBMO|nr:unnamed protein product [Ambrosiozyma monospora]